MRRFEAKLLMFEGDVFIMSEGRAQILKAIQGSGSISKAAKQMGMSYRHIWGNLRKMEERCGAPLIESVRGGRRGGMTTLTDLGKTALEEYSLKSKAIERALRFGPRPSLTVDGVLIEDGKIVLVQRKNPPFKGKWALPGGFVENNETVEEAVVREFREETSFKSEVAMLVGVFSEPGRDPRGHIVSVVYLLRRIGGRLKAGDDAGKCRWFPLDGLPGLAFDHEQILDLVKKTCLKGNEHKL